MLEFSIPVAGDVAMLRELPQNVKIGLGCVDVRFPEIEPRGAIAERVEKALPHVAPPSGISLNPDCGFAPEGPRDSARRSIRQAEYGAARRLLRHDRCIMFSR